MKTQKHLWAGDWRERQRDEVGPPEAPAPAAPARAPADADGPAPAVAARPRLRIPTGAALGGFGLGALLAVAAIVIGGLGRGDGSSARTLPAAASTPIVAKAGQTPVGAIYAAASPAVVSIRTGTGSGTGFLIDDKGTVVTNAHVVAGSSAVTVRFGENGGAISGRVAGTDPSSDLAVVRIEPSRVPSGTKPLQLADSGKVGVGDTVVAIGNPFGLDRTATEGIVSALGRDIQAPNGFQISNAIQTDAAINPGNSGGPLLDDGGKVIGVNSQIETAGVSSGNVGVGFAVPSNTVRRVVPVLQEGGKIARAWLGVSMSDANGNGARVEQTVPGSPAAAAGLRAGDVITAVDGKAVADSSALGQLVEARRPGDRVTLKVLRGGRPVDVGVALRTRPAQAP